MGAVIPQVVRLWSPPAVVGVVLGSLVAALLGPRPPQEGQVTREEMTELLRRWEALDAAAQRVESALPHEMSAAITEQTSSGSYSERDY
jgi:hypothetical protein